MIPHDVDAASLASLLGPVQAFMEDRSVAAVMINGPDQIFIERAGKLELTKARFESGAAVLAVVRSVARFAGAFVDEQSPIFEARLPDGSRVEALIAPLVQGGPVVAIRRGLARREPHDHPQHRGRGPRP
jgi:pilus assembly protein CpaF